MENADLKAARERRNALRREQYRLDGGKRRAENQRWKDEHREQVREASREYQRLRRKDPEVAQRGREMAKEWYHNNKEAAKEQYKNWKAKNPGYHTEWNRQNRKKKPELYLWRSVRNRAKSEGIVFSLSSEDILVPEYCPALGIKLAIGASGMAPECASVDRVIPELGYVKGNIRVISMRANVIKRNATPEELEKVAAYSRQETEKVRELLTAEALL